MPVDKLERLQEGWSKTLRTSHLSELSISKDFDGRKFERGKTFFRKNLTSCVLAMLCSLVCGLSITNLLEPLVFTGKSDTPRKSLRRYLQTLVHVVKWHYGNVWDKTSDAYISLSSVLQMHINVSLDMTREKDGKLYVSQYDMSLVQCGFMGAIIMYPEKFGISCNEKDLDDYVYFWRWIGYLLGMSDENNICSSGYKHARAVCKDIEKYIMLPALKNPPDNFYPMADAFTKGANLLTYFPVHSTESVIGFSLDIMGKDRLPHTFGDKIRILHKKFIIALIWYCPIIKRFFNRVFEKICGCDKMT